MRTKTVVPSFPSFSIPKTRTESNVTLLKLTKNFESQGFSRNDAKSMASQIISGKRQGLTDSQISKNIEDGRIGRRAFAQKQAQKREDARESQKDLLEKLAKQKAETVKLQAQRKSRQSRATRNKPKVILVANPDNPRGALIPKSVAGAIIKKRKEQGKDRGTSSLTSNNPSTVAKIKQFLSAQKDDSSAKVIAVNRSFVLLDNGKKIPRNSFKGKIPAELLSRGRKRKIPENNASLEDIERNKAIITNPSSNVITKKNASNSTKPSKTKRPSKSVFQKDKPETTPIADTIEVIQESVSDFIDSVTNPTPETKADTTKETEPINPLKLFTDFFASLTKSPETKTETPKETKPQPTKITEPQPTKPTEQKPTTQQPKQETTPETQDKESGTIQLIKENAGKIAIGAVGAMMLGVVVLGTMGNMNAISEVRNAKS